MSFECVNVEKLYAKYDKLKVEDVRILQEWLKKESHLPKLEELQVAAFLHSCYYKIELAKITLDNYFTNKTLYSDIFNHISEDDLKRTLSTTFMSILPKKTPQKYIILMAKLNHSRVENFNFHNSAAVVNMIATLHLHQVGMEKGAVVVFDAKGFTFAHLAKFNINSLRHILNHVQEAAPVRIKNIHFVNMIPAVDKAISLVKPFLRSEVFGVFKFHASCDTLYNDIPKECLPSDYGGELPSTQELQELSLQNMLENYAFFKWHDSQTVDESKRIGESKSEMFGMEGTFKRLEID